MNPKNVLYQELLKIDDMVEILDKKQRRYLIEVFYKDGLQACLKEAKTKGEMAICNEEVFIEYHKTGYIQEGTYDQYEKDLPWIKKNEHPILYKTITVNDEELELRKSGEKLQYVKTDKSGEILRDKKGMALYLSDAEMEKKELPTHDTCIVAFNKKGEAVGYASDEFGATGVYVLKAYQHKGVGLELLTEYRKQFKPERRLGQMTPSGEQLARKYFRTM